MNKQQNKQQVKDEYNMTVACVSFLNELEKHNVLTNDQLFCHLAELAANVGYTLIAEQRGIQGTYIYFGDKKET